MAKRLKYTRDILTHMLGNNNAGANKERRNNKNNNSNTPTKKI